MQVSQKQGWIEGAFWLLLFLLPWIVYGGNYPSMLVKELDHCPQMACDFTRHYLPQAQHMVAGEKTLNAGWFYPPLLGLLLMPLVHLETPEVFWTGLNVFGVGVLCVQAFRFKPTPRTMMLALGLVSTSLPILHALKWGQVSIWIAVGLLLVMNEVVSDNPKKGWVLGILGAIKVYPMLLLVLPLLKRSVHWVGVALLSAFLFGVLIPWLMLGETFALYVYAVQRGQMMVSDMATTSGGQALLPVLHRWFVSAEFVGLSNSEAPLIASWASLKWGLIVAFILGSVRVVWRTWEQRDVSLKFAFQTLMAVHLLLQPGWVHYFCWLPVVQVWIWVRANRPTKVLLVFALVVERLPLLMLSQERYFLWSQAGGMTVSVLLSLVALSLLRSEPNTSQA